MYSAQSTFSRMSIAFSVLVFLPCSAFAGNDACTVLSAAKFSEIAGYKVDVNKQASNDTVCMYKGAGNAGGGILMIIDEAASPRKLEMVNQQGSVPQGKAGKLGATFSKGTIVFSVGMIGTDPSRVNALAAEVKRNLK